MNSWRWRTIAAAIFAGVIILVISHAVINLAGTGTGSITDWRIFDIPIGTILQIFVFPFIVIAVVFVHCIRQEIIDRRYDERRHQ
ncbi:MAG: hypothetical protein AAF362_13270 [Pseudomonadota bacterium]